MSIQLFQHIKEAISSLNPEEIERHVDKPVQIFLYAHTEEAYRQMEDFLAPPRLSAAKRADVGNRIHRASSGFAPAGGNDLEIYFEDSPPDGLTPIKDVFPFQPGNPHRLVSEVLRQRPDLAIPLAIHMLPFRQEVSRRIVKKVSKQNAMFALATAVPDIIPFVSLPWAVGEFASDSAVLTANQVRMAFLLAAAADRDFGYREQRNEIASIVLGAFGWRALARELVGKIPLGGGLIPKGAIAYAGTRVVGLSLERFYRTGAAYTRQERRDAYGDALERGRAIATSLLNRVKAKAVAQS
ncbi:MAG TPA: hypothetical protein VKX49_13045 [Bryobacteraceae bacterium]|nr:hypothetical protein [Bryobacteraceae bacterium]